MLSRVTPTGMRLHELVPTIQLAIGPVILVSGVGLLLLSMTNRFGRVIDRSRQLSEAVRQSNSEAGPPAMLEAARRRQDCPRRAGQ
jgi:hypothetical protein